MPAFQFDLYVNLIRPLLFRFPTEPAQRIAEFALKTHWVWRAIENTLRLDHPGLEVDLFGLKLRNPVGLAAGFDKNCRFLPSLAALGFGYLVGGTVTRFTRLGNPKPRMFRNSKEQSLINALGFPNKGLESVARNLRDTTWTRAGTPRIVSVSGTNIDEMVDCHRHIEPLVDAVELNVSSPNTNGLRVFHDTVLLGDLLDKVSEARDKPLVVKLPPYTTIASSGSDISGAKKKILNMAKICAERGVDGLTVANSRPMDDLRLSTGSGGLSGKPLFADTLRMVTEVRSVTGNGVFINSCGGIFTGEDAWQALQAGANTIQIYTGLVFRGPATVKNINRELIAIMKREGKASVGEV